MKIAVILSISLNLLLTTPLASGGRVRYPSQNLSFGSSNPAPCCRSNFPEEYGSCLNNEHCPQPTAPYCSAFGFCTQQKQYGYDGCVPCQAVGGAYPQ